MNIYDVAKLAGVSIATASKALNGRKDVREETRERVLDVAKKLNYHPSHLARGLAKRRTENIGVIALRRFHSPILTNPFYSRVIEGMENEITRANYNLLFTIIPAEESGEVMVPKMVREKNVDALCVMGESSDGFLREIAARAIPMAVVDFYSESIPGHYVVSDNALGARLAVEHLLELGHTRLGFIGDKAKDYSFVAREKAFEAELSEAGLKPGPRLELDFSTKGSDLAVSEYLHRKDLPTALVACNDAHALFVMELAIKAGLKVPQELSIVGFDDIEDAGRATPPLSTIRVEKQEMGAKAIHIVLDLIAHPDARPKKVETPVHLVARLSTDKPGK